MQIFKFAFVGGIGFIADTLVFFVLMKWLSLPIMPARVLAFIVAATVTWFGNRTFTFAGAETGGKLRQWVKFMCCATLSAVPNLLTFKLGLMLVPESSDIWLFTCMVVGILVGMVSNFLLSKYWVFEKVSLPS